MELYDGLLTRRSIRKYTGEIIDEEKILLMVKAGMYAPSANNMRPWHFIIVSERELLLKIKKIHPYASMLSEASHAIVVCGDEEHQNGPGYYILDCSAATQNILLAAHALGYGAVWLGVEPRTERKNQIRHLFGILDKIHPVAIVSIGVPVKIPEKIPARLEPEKIRMNTWA